MIGSASILHADPRLGISFTYDVYILSEVLGEGYSTTTCWRGNELAMQVIQAKNMAQVTTYTTDYEDYVDEHMFDLPKSCNQQSLSSFASKIKRHTMNGVFPQNICSNML